MWGLAQFIRTIKWVIRRSEVLLEKEAVQTVFLIRKGAERRPGLILLEQLKGILEEVGVLLESLGSLLENRRSLWQEVCSFSRIRGCGRRASDFIRTIERIIRTTAADIR